MEVIICGWKLAHACTQEQVVMLPELKRTSLLKQPPYSTRTYPYKYGEYVGMTSISSSKITIGAEHQLFDAIDLAKIHCSHGCQVLSSATAPIGAASRWQLVGSGRSAGSRLLQQDMPERRGACPRGDGEDHVSRIQPCWPSPQASLP